MYILGLLSARWRWLCIEEGALVWAARAWRRDESGASPPSTCPGLVGKSCCLSGRHSTPPPPHVSSAAVCRITSLLAKTTLRIARLEYTIHTWPVVCRCKLNAAGLAGFLGRRIVDDSRRQPTDDRSRSQLLWFCPSACGFVDGRKNEERRSSEPHLRGFFCWNLPHLAGKPCNPVAPLPSLSTNTRVLWQSRTLFPRLLLVLPGFSRWLGSSARCEIYNFDVALSPVPVRRASSRKRVSLLVWFTSNLRFERGHIVQHNVDWGTKENVDPAILVFREHPTSS